MRHTSAIEGAVLHRNSYLPSAALSTEELWGLAFTGRRCLCNQVHAIGATLFLTRFICYSLTPPRPQACCWAPSRRHGYASGWQRRGSEGRGSPRAHNARAHVEAQARSCRRPWQLLAQLALGADRCVYLNYAARLYVGACSCMRVIHIRQIGQISWLSKSVQHTCAYESCCAAIASTSIAAASTVEQAWLWFGPVCLHLATPRCSRHDVVWGAGELAPEAEEYFAVKRKLEAIPDAGVTPFPTRPLSERATQARQSPSVRDHSQGSAKWRHAQHATLTSE